MPQKRKKRQSRNLNKVAVFAPSTTPAKKPKRGRPTIWDNHLLGTRNAWVSLLEESWPEIGWHLLNIRARRKGTIEDTRKIFEPVKQKIHNPGLATSFYRESTEPANASETLRNRISVGKLDAEIHALQAKREECQRSCRDVEIALKEASPDDKIKIEAEGTRRQQRLIQFESDLGQFGSERDALYKKTLDQEAYLSRSELLDYLISRRYAINPRNLANALAGLPGMKWRQSHLRCSRMSFEAEARPEFQVFEMLSRIWNHQSWASQEPPIELFRADLLKHSKKSANTKQFLRKNWRDLKFAIDECWESNPIPDSLFPFLLASMFMRILVRPKNAAEQILTEQDSLGAS
jgi:hypothetical protein